MGLEDLKTLKRVFSSSNMLVAVTQLASAFQWQLYIEMHFKQWDKDKYANLATMLHNNYHQALKIIKSNGHVVEEAKHSLSIMDEDLESWRIEQEEYFQALGDEPESKICLSPMLNYYKSWDGLSKYTCIISLVTPLTNSQFPA